jgi:hypothetical protein
MIDALLSYDRVRFNNLPPIEEADIEMKASGRLSVALSVLGPLFARHDMCNEWGIGLLHKHWYLLEDEFPVQEMRNTTDGPEYVLSPGVVGRSARCWPSVLAVRGVGTPSLRLEPLEYSTDIRVGKANDTLASGLEFQREFCDLIRQHHLANTFGLVVARDSSRPGRELIEFNYAIRISVLREAYSSEHDSASLIQTSWRFAADAATASCKASCFVTCTVSGGGHSKAHNKLHNPNG